MPHEIALKEPLRIGAAPLELEIHRIIVDAIPDAWGEECWKSGFLKLEWTRMLVADGNTGTRWLDKVQTSTAPKRVYVPTSNITGIVEL